MRYDAASYIPRQVHCSRSKFLQVAAEFASTKMDLLPARRDFAPFTKEHAGAREGDGDPLGPPKTPNKQVEFLSFLGSGANARIRRGLYDFFFGRSIDQAIDGSTTRK
jgi:hypothetical protein